jgi:hypothetical protein
MRLLKTKPFNRWARKEGLRDKALSVAAGEMRHRTWGWTKRRSSTRWRTDN